MLKSCMKKILFTLLLLFPISVFAYTSPGSPAGFVNDFAGVLSQEKKQEMETILQDYKNSTGNEIAIVFIQELKDETIESYAVRLFEEWGIGSKDKDNGVLFLASISDREMRIEVGYGLEGDLTDIESKRIITDAVKPYFASGDYNGGALAAIEGIKTAIGGEYASAGNGKVQGPGLESFLFGNFWFIIFIFIWLGSILSRSRSWWLGGVIGAVAGIVFWVISGSWIYLPVLIIVGLVFDYIVSKKYKESLNKDNKSGIWPWLIFFGGNPGKPWDKGNNFFGTRGGRGGFGGFGGGRSGGGGASGGW